MPMHTLSTATDPMRERFYEDLLPYLLARVGRLVSARFYEELQLSGTSTTRWRLLATLFDGKPRTIGALAEEILLEQSSATRLVERTERAGLVAKRADPEDRRRSLVTITPAGRTFIRDVGQRAVTVDAGIMATLPPETAERLKDDLRTVISVLAGTSFENGVEIDPSGK